jgi:hypothetical protein
MTGLFWEGRMGDEDSSLTLGMTGLFWERRMCDEDSSLTLGMTGLFWERRMGDEDSSLALGMTGLFWVVEEAKAIRLGESPSLPSLTTNELSFRMNPP